MPRKGTPSGKPFIWISLEASPAADAFNARAGAVGVPGIVLRPSDAAADAAVAVVAANDGDDGDDDDDDGAVFALGSVSIGASSFRCTYTNDGSVPNTRGSVVS